ncbi:hypothetical protein JoomaDRAFT_2087 [Galbibacter orientalis DSM 19592]|uniref:Uncharacterized protein n=1 Tax=Galbibacter orientalis DSM 19592 TaxID=926559 RepID=I3C638_9FLAO|nr:hypothetical protein JoomaDRAFT_2087 [Galbibacter orientalis DSM 19592]
MIKSHHYEKILKNYRFVFNYRANLRHDYTLLLVKTA